MFAKELAGSKDEQTEDVASASGLSSAQHEISLLIKEDLAFLIPLLRQFPKCYWIWNHRAWLLQQASERLPTSSAKALWQAEMGLVGKMLSYDSRNFHGWSYRRKVVSSLEHLRLQELKDGKDTTEAQQNEEELHSKASMTEDEYAYTTKMIKTNLSNFSAWHNRSQLIPRLLNERQADSTARRQLLDEEFDLIIQALFTDPYDQSLWFYHQYLMTTLSPACPTASLIVQDLTNLDRLEYLDTQIDLLKDMLEGSEDCKWIYQALLTYSAMYFDIEAGNKKVSTIEMRAWLEELEKLDPLRQGRWQDWRKSLCL